MQFIKKWTFILPLLFLLAVVAVACDEQAPQPIAASHILQAPTDDQLKQSADNLWTIEGGKLKPIRGSSELANLIERINRTNDPNHVWYVYLFSNDGKLMYYSPIKGKVSNTDSSPTNPDGVGCDHVNSSTSCTTNSLPALDGSYGKNEPGIFFFLRNGPGTMVESNLMYVVTDSYIPMSQQPVLVAPQN